MSGDPMRHANEAVRWADRAFALAMLAVWTSLIPAFPAAMRLLGVQFEPWVMLAWVVVTAVVVYLVWRRASRSHAS